LEGRSLLLPLKTVFFGNRSIEIDEVYLQRRMEKKRYKSKKINVALGAKVLSKKELALDIGVSLKRNPEVKKINPGVGVSARLWIFNFGAYIYKDDTKLEFENYINQANQLPYSDIYGATYTETFTAKTLSVGTQIGSLSLDAGMIKTKYAFYAQETSIIIYSGAYNYKKFLFNLAYRKESSDNLKENKSLLTYERDKVEYYAGVQYLWNSHITTGLAYNHFLVKDISLTLTLFL
jgi:hypothetical protein